MCLQQLVEIDGIRDVDESHLEKAEHLAFSSIELEEKGPLRAVVKCGLDFGKSKGVVLVSRGRGGAYGRSRWILFPHQQTKHRAASYALILICRFHTFVMDVR